jgi:hypothetical protein
MATISSFVDILDEARRYLSAYDSAGVIGHPEAAEEVAERAARRWRSGHSLGSASDKDIDDLYRLVEEEAAEYAADTTRYLDGTTLGPCIARDVDRGYVRHERPSAREAKGDDDYLYILTIWRDGSATLECVQRDDPGNGYWTYPVGPGEDLRFFEGVPWEVLDRFQLVSPQGQLTRGNTKQQEKSNV